jgi:hypothetical protein
MKRGGFIRWCMEHLGHRRPLLLHTGHHDGLLLLVKTIQLLSQTCDRFLGAEYKSRPADILGVTENKRYAALVMVINAII